MSTLIAGNEGGVSITKYARGTNVSNLGVGYQVTWVKKGNRLVTNSLDFDNEDTARAFYHMVYLSYDIE